MKLFFGANDYNLILEKILDSKYFSSNAKSLLLSMIYKIENFYEDYKTVKNISKTKEEFLNEIIDDIKKYCDNIKLVEPDSDEAKIIKENNLLAVTNEEERSILSYPTEVALLYAISDVIPKFFYVPSNFLFKSSMQQLLVNGYNENNLEILSDFNGWSWDIDLKYKNNLQDNLIYQNFLILLGNEFLDEWLIQNTKDINYLDKIKLNLYNTKYFEYLCKYLYINTDKKDREKLDKLCEEKKQELRKISNKPKYFEELKSKKMKYLKEVEKIDKLLNDKDALRNEYIKKNLKLEESKRLPTVNSYRKIVEKRRKVCLENITLIGKSMSPIDYMKNKKELEDFINSIDYKVNNEEELMIMLQEEFIKALEIKLSDLETVDELLDYIYKLRYYRFLYITNEKQVKDIENLDVKIQDIFKLAIVRALENDILRKITTNNKFNSEIINIILDTKIMNLKEIKFEIAIKESEMQVRVYEKEVYEKDFIIPCSYTKKEILVKLNKSVKLFI